MDAENEKLVRQALSVLLRGKIVWVIAHRMRTIANVDKAVVLDQGCVAEMGAAWRTSGTERLVPAFGCGADGTSVKLRTAAVLRQRDNSFSSQAWYGCCQESDQ